MKENKKQAKKQKHAMKRAHALRLTSVTVKYASMLQNVELEVVSGVLLRVTEWTEAHNVVRLILGVRERAAPQVRHEVRVLHFKMSRYKGRAAARRRRAATAGGRARSARTGDGARGGRGRR